MTKAVFFDIDGTLVSFETHKVPESTVRAIELLKQKGINVFIATGRQKDAITNLGTLEFDGYVTLNGGCTIVDNQIIDRNHIPKEDICTLIKLLETETSFPVIFVYEGGSFVSYQNETVEFIMNDSLKMPIPDVQPLRNALDKDIFQILAFFPPEKEDEIMKKLPNTSSARWSPHFTDLVPKGISKTVGIDNILNHFGFSLDEAMAFGDGGNDISMLKHVPMSIAMGNAGNEVKKAASYTTTSVNDNGIWNALKNLNVI